MKQKELALKLKEAEAELSTAILYMTDFEREFGFDRPKIVDESIKTLEKDIETLKKHLSERLNKFKLLTK